MLSEATPSSQLAMLLGLLVRVSHRVLPTLPSMMPYRISLVLGSRSSKLVLPLTSVELSLDTAFTRLRTSSSTP